MTAGAPLRSSVPGLQPRPPGREVHGLSHRGPGPPPALGPGAASVYPARCFLVSAGGRGPSSAQRTRALGASRGGSVSVLGRPLFGPVWGVCGARGGGGHRSCEREKHLWGLSPAGPHLSPPCSELRSRREQTCGRTQGQSAFQSGPLSSSGRSGRRAAPPSPLPACPSAERKASAVRKLPARCSHPAEADCAPWAECPPPHSPRDCSCRPGLARGVTVQPARGARRHACVLLLAGQLPHGQPAPRPWQVSLTLSTLDVPWEPWCWCLPLPRGLRGARPGAGPWRPAHTS
uniref:Uncharacterized protein n=1 Tax=Rousettus aegyptiacus TaxID=9407 RepID=A0A7J8BAA6_ROUAE|nr:hypothetical protein HJG63_009952 [Rousettus aegyptiacus]